MSTALINTGGTAGIVSPAVLVAIQVTPDGQTIAAATTTQLAATGIFSDGTSVSLTNVTWTSANTSIATVSSTGLVTGISPGRDTISVTSGNITGTTALTVSAASLTAVAIAPPSASLAKGTTVQYRLTGTFTDNSTQDITSLATWSSSNTSVATVSASGLASAIQVGSTSITGSYGGLNSTANLTVTNATLLSIAVTPNGDAIANGTKVQFTATGTFSDGTTQDLTSSVTYRVSVPAVANISTTGLAKGDAPGTTIINATDLGVTGNATLTVTPAVLVSLTVTPNPLTLANGTIGTLQAIGTFSDHSTQDLSSEVTWASAKTTVATVSNVYPTRGQVASVAIGSTSVSATYSGISSSATVTVTAATVESLVITPSNITTNLSNIGQGSTVNFTLVATFSDNSTQNITTGGTFVSSPAGFTSGNTFDATATGNFTITGSFDGLSSSTNVTVVQSATSGPILFAGYADGTLQAYTVGPDTGILTAVPGYPVSADDSGTVGFTGPVTSIVSSLSANAIYTSELSAAGQFAIGYNPVPANGLVTSAPESISYTPSAISDIALVAGGQSIVYSSSNMLYDLLLNADGSFNSQTQIPYAGPGAAIAGPAHYPFVYVAGPTTIQGFSTITGAALNTVTATCDQLAADPGGRFLAGSTSATNTINVFTVSFNGSLTQASFITTLAPVTKLFIGNDAHVVFALEASANQMELFPLSPTGVISASGGAVATGTNPVGIDFNSTQQFLFVANGGDNTVETFAVVNGTATVVQGSPFNVTQTASGASLTSINVYH